MDRRVEGTYTSKEETVSAVERLINEGYASDEIIIVTNEKHEKELEDLTLVEVDAVNPTEGLSLWEKLKESFSFGRYNSDEVSNPFEEYGVEEDIGEHYTEALESGEIVILVNSAGPSKTQQLSQVNEEVLNGHAEQVAKDPVKAPTKEKTDAIPGEGEQFDPSKAQSSREDIEGNPVTAPDKQSSNSDVSISPITTNQKQDDKILSSENEGHVYPDNISKGVVDGGVSSHSKGIEKTSESKPELNSTQPESDAYYSNSYEEAGGKTIRKDDEDK